LGEIRTNKGFFEREKKRVLNKKVEAIITTIGAHEDRPLTVAECSELKDFFVFDLYNDPNMVRQEIAKRLKVDEKELDGFTEDELVHAEFGKRTFNVIKSNLKGFQNVNLLKCKLCDMRKACKAPVLPSPSNYNMMIVAEGAGRQEDLKKEGLVGKSGQSVWNEMGRYGLKRQWFHVTNVEKCFPGSDKKDFTPANINKCYIWLDEEIQMVKPLLVLAFGKEALRYFTGKEGGIMALSGETEWNPRWACWICWCVHPSALFHGHGKVEFERGIKNFTDKVRMFAQ